jgi:hypothetical protein
MAFDWQIFLDQRGIPYSFGYPHAPRYIGIKCPFCGDAGTNPHRHRLGINPDGKGWRCLRDNSHSGISPVRLVAALLNCSSEEAARLIGYKSSTALLGGVVGTLLEEITGDRASEAVEASGPLEFPDNIKRLDQPSGIRAIFLKYLCSRGYTSNEARDLVEVYGLRGSLGGPFAYRLIFPVEMPDGLATWTGRTIVKEREPRYKTLSADPAKAAETHLPCARMTIGQCLWNAKELETTEGKLLIACEGPFDALRIDYYGRSVGIRATCLFGKSLRMDQIFLLNELGSFKTRVLCLDTDALFDMLIAVNTQLKTQIGYLDLPPGRKDPALLSRIDIEKLL